MSNEIQIIKQLIADFEVFKQEKPNQNIDYNTFVEYLCRKPNQKKTKAPVDYSQQTAFSPYETPEISIGTYITSLFRYAKNYTKAALENTPFGTIDDFGFAASLLQQESLTKTELIHLHLMEITSGTEVIKRLKKHGIIYEFNDPLDRRSKRVALTSQGRRAIIQSFNRMNTAAEIISGDLNTTEKQQLLSLMDKLKLFHDKVHEHDKKSELEEIAKKYL